MSVKITKEREHAGEGTWFEALAQKMGHQHSTRVLLRAIVDACSYTRSVALCLPIVSRI